jgi:hypothetical protein
MANGCLQQIGFCRATNISSATDYAICTEAENICRDTVEGVYYNIGERGVVSLLKSLMEAYLTFTV